MTEPKGLLRGRPARRPASAWNPLAALLGPPIALAAGHGGWGPPQGPGGPQGYGHGWGAPQGFAPGPMGQPPMGQPPIPPMGDPTRNAPPAAPKKSSAGKNFAIIVGLLGALVGLFFLVRAGAGCAATKIVERMPPSTDARIGREAAKSFKAKLTVTDKAEQRERVERIFKELQAGLTPEQKATLLAANVTVVVDKTPNAFALPGGEVFVLTGLLDRVGDDDDMLRGVLAHELGHAVLRHGMRSIVRSGIYALLLGILVGGLDDVSGYVVSQAGELDKLSFSRDMEESADAFAVDLLARTGHDAEGLAKFLESLGSQPVPELLSTHPDSEDRAKEIRKRSKKKK